MLAKHYPELFAGEPELARAGRALRREVARAVSFLVDVLKVDKVAARYEGTVAYHDSCAGLRELGVKAQPRKLLAGVEGLKLVEIERGGDLLRLRRPVRRQIRRALRTRSSRAKPPTSGGAKADTVLAGDLGCLMNMAGKLQREGSP